MRIIELLEEDRGCVECGSKRFYHQGYGADGGCQTWLEAQCVNCRKEHELWSPVKYKRIWSESELVGEIDLVIGQLEISLKREKLEPTPEVLAQVADILKQDLLAKSK